MMEIDGTFSIGHGMFDSPHPRQCSPAVTVIAVCYNHERFVIECLESIRLQGFTDFELIIVDDKSSDSSVKLISHWVEETFPRARFVAHQNNIGLCKTLNEALALSSGEFIALIATDDAWLPNKLQSQVARMRELPTSVAVVFSDAEQMDEQGNTLPNTFIEEHRPSRATLSMNTFSELADGNFIPAMSTLIRRNALGEVGGYDENLTYEDYDVWLRLADKFQFDFLPGAVARYRIVATSMVRTLFANPSARHSYSVYLIHRKWIGSNKLTSAQRIRWASKISSAAYSLYFAEDPRAAKCLRFAAIVAPGTRAFLLAFSASFGITRSRAKRLSAIAGFGGEGGTGTHK